MSFRNPKMKPELDVYTSRINLKSVFFHFKQLVYLFPAFMVKCRISFIVFEAIFEREGIHGYLSLLDSISPSE